MTPLEPELFTTTLLAMAIGFTMFFSGIKKHALELKRRRRICPSCGRHISGAVCREH
jgi:hypothetical protein